MRNGEFFSKQNAYVQRNRAMFPEAKEIQSKWH
uniref:Uncharacterized protein n=1 Tax=Siphoviridae sp. ctljn1 TaxID=2826448 RepID=A0A8S5R1F7_9CAUD|nr:MAG TPA: hypothetical protein [Siphoviridae sp. ctljn1]